MASAGLTVTAPNEVTVRRRSITEGLQRIDGVTYEFQAVRSTPNRFAARRLLPEQKVLMAFVLVFSPKQHASPVRIISITDDVLESLKALQGYDRIIIGHDTPVDHHPIDPPQHDDLRRAPGARHSVDAKLWREPKSRFPSSARPAL